MSSIIAVGDLHGKLDIAKELLQDKEQRIIFIGDYLDSFSGNIEEQQELLEMVLDAVQTRDNVSALMGNHELSYLESHYRASGFSWILASNLGEKNLGLMRKHLDLWIEEDSFLFSHAGMSLNWIPVSERDNPMGYLVEATLPSIYQIGYSRGGNYPCGGLLWCDYYEEFKPVPDIKQVFGHTARAEVEKGIRTDDAENYCIDCLDRVTEVIEIADGAVKFRSVF